MSGTEYGGIPGTAHRKDTCRPGRGRGNWLFPLSIFQALGLLLLVTLSAASLGAQQTLAADYAVYEEHSPETKPM